MRIRNVPLKGLRRFIEDDDAAGLPPHLISKLRNMVSFLENMANESELYAIPIWKAHRLTGDRKGTWSLFVSRNWRLTFCIDHDEVEIVDLNFEDYH